MKCRVCGNNLRVVNTSGVCPDEVGCRRRAAERAADVVARHQVVRAAGGARNRRDMMVVPVKLRARIIRVRGKLSVTAWVVRAIEEKLDRAEQGSGVVAVTRGDLPVPAGRAVLGGELDARERVRLIRAVRMLADGADEGEVARVLGYPSGVVLRQLAERETGRLLSHELSDYREAMVHELMDTLAEYRDTAARPGFRYDVKGDLLLAPDGQPEVDQDVRVKANNGRVQAVHELSHLLALALPPAKFQSVAQETLVEAIKALARELAAGEVSDDDQQAIIDGVIAEG